MRMHMRRFTRLTNGFSKKIQNHIHMVALYTVFYNFTKVHKTLRVTPAMQAGLRDHVWSMEEIVRLLEKVETPVAVAQANRDTTECPAKWSERRRTLRGSVFHQAQELARASRSMLVAVGFSSLLLINYVVNHVLRGDTPFPGVGTARTVYLSILASHSLFSVVALPLVLTTVFFALSGRFRMHRRLARVTFPIWLYVSVTGVVVFVFLKAYAY
jgi:hypothetical protein